MGRSLALVQSLAVPKPDGSLSAVIVSGGKQYRVAPGDRILVDRISAEAGASVKLGRVLLFSNGNEIKVGNPAVDGLDVDARVIGHPRGPRIESLRYKSKKRVRVHRGGRADLTALEIIAVGGIGVEKQKRQPKQEQDPEQEPEEEAAEKPRRGRAKAAPRVKAGAAEATKPRAAPKKTATRRTTGKETK